LIVKSTSHLHESIKSETLFLLWQFLTSAHDDERALYDIADGSTGEFKGHKNHASAESERPKGLGGLIVVVRDSLHKVYIPVERRADLRNAKGNLCSKTQRP